MAKAIVLSTSIKPFWVSTLHFIMSSSFIAQLPPVAKTSTLGWVHDDVAQSYMEHLLQRVRVILTARRWHVGILKEFYPRGEKLLGLNVNKGSEVCVRFRVPGNRNEFLPFHEVLCTTLHELAHCEISRHDKAFWRLYYDLVRECEELEVRMIQRGIALYPVHVNTAQTTYTAQRQQAAAAGGRARTGATAPTPKATRKRTRAQPTIAQGQTLSAADTFLALPGEGHRLGGDSLTAALQPPGGPPPQDDAEVRRRLLADATLRRIAHLMPRVPPSEPSAPSSSPSPRAPTDATPLSEWARIAASHYSEEATSGAVDDDARTSKDVGDKESWPCDRCGFLNSNGSGTCEMCSDDVSAVILQSYLAEKVGKAASDAGNCADLPIEISDDDT